MERRADTSNQRYRWRKREREREREGGRNLQWRKLLFPRKSRSTFAIRKRSRIYSREVCRWFENSLRRSYVLSEMENSLCTERGKRAGGWDSSRFHEWKTRAATAWFLSSKIEGNDSFTSDDIDDCRVGRRVRSLVNVALQLSQATCPPCIDKVATRRVSRQLGPVNLD